MDGHEKKQTNKNPTDFGFCGELCLLYYAESMPGKKRSVYFFPNITHSKFLLQHPIKLLDIHNETVFPPGLLFLWMMTEAHASCPAQSCALDVNTEPTCNVTSPTLTPQ